MDIQLYICIFGFAYINGWCSIYSIYINMFMAYGIPGFHVEVNIPMAPMGTGEN